MSNDSSEATVSPPQPVIPLSKHAILVGLFFFLTLYTTSVFQVPIVQPDAQWPGYFDVGDVAVMLGGLYMRSPIFGFVVGGLGSAVADVLTGSWHFALLTFIAKG